MGSPDFALPTLRALAEHYDVVGVVTQPDRASGRGRELKPPPVKLLAQELQIPVMQPEKLRQPEAMEQLRLWSPDLIVVADQRRHPARGRGNGRDHHENGCGAGYWSPAHAEIHPSHA